ncbi:polysaccharide biosynthesis/export family protein [Polaribacter sp. MSW13]|uniref:Polysaccharide biosynthesis/export family protein n=1 Tax=Polaribacter marinus TaxID=2916838 RepID=A0A9X1VK06_9FLAO|nr:polysaccharide biosynthesis/export family protein [Polaribacter marinus]MCI2227556.1 polysaccharide biosynthesis/export family protein [Polaribacter marinus]
MNYMRLQKKMPFLLLIALFLLGACVSKKDIVYFQNDEIDQALVNNSYQTIIKPDDLLIINISAIDVEAVQPFNLPVVSYSITTDRAVGQAMQQSYLVDSKGRIDFPVLGSLQIGGLTREEAIQLFKDKLDPTYVKDPTINIRITNYKIAVLGDVQKPGTYTIPNERISIIDAIALAGDLNISAQRNNIMVQREEGNKKVQYRVDLLSNKINTSPVFYLQQNDVVYVEQNYARIQSASSNSNTSLFISITGLVMTIISILIR